MALLEVVFNHLVLPPKLPEHRDKAIEGIQQCILSRLIWSCDTLGKVTGPQYEETWASIRHSLRVALSVNLGRLEKTAMLQEFGLLILYVVEQNAALLIRRRIQ